MQLDLSLNCSKIFDLLFKSWSGGFGDPAWGWVGIVYCATEFNKAMCM